MAINSDPYQKSLAGRHQRRAAKSRAALHGQRSKSKTATLGKTAGARPRRLVSGFGCAFLSPRKIKKLWVGYGMRLRPSSYFRSQTFYKLAVRLRGFKVFSAGSPVVRRKHPGGSIPRYPDGGGGRSGCGAPERAEERPPGGAAERATARRLFPGRRFSPLWRKGRCASPDGSATLHFEGRCLV